MTSHENEPIDAENELVDLVVTGAETISPGFVRVTARTEPGRALPDHGYDQWFRLFLPQPGTDRAVLPHGPAAGWYRRWLAMPDEERPVCRNYTARAVRPLPGGGTELDIDFVLHRSASGEVEGEAGGWAATATAGARIGILDQALVCRPELMTGHVVVIADPAGLPAAEGIARSLPAGSRAEMFLDVTDEADRRPLPGPGSAPGLNPGSGSVEVHWFTAAAGESAARIPGTEWADRLSGATPYVYLIGGQTFVADVTEALAPLRLTDARRETPPPTPPPTPKGHLHPCAYWR